MPLFSLPVYLKYLDLHNQAHAPLPWRLCNDCSYRTRVYTDMQGVLALFLQSSNSQTHTLLPISAVALNVRGYVEAELARARQYGVFKAVWQAA